MENRAWVKNILKFPFNIEKNHIFIKIVML